MSIQANYETRPVDFPKKKENKVEASFMKMANEKDYQENNMNMKRYKQDENSEGYETLQNKEKPQRVSRYK